jgi:hypothetical protein
VEAINTAEMVSYIPLNLHSASADQKVLSIHTHDYVSVPAFVAFSLALRYTEDGHELLFTKTECTMLQQGKCVSPSKESLLLICNNLFSEDFTSKEVHAN